MAKHSTPKRMIEEMRLELIEAGCETVTIQNYENAARTANFHSQHARDPYSHRAAAKHQLIAAKAAKVAGYDNMVAHHYGHAGHHEKMARLGFNDSDHRPQWSPLE